MEKNKIKQAILQQKRCQASVATVVLHDFEVLDRTSSALPNRTLRQILLEWQSPHLPNVRLFLAVEPCWTGQGYSLVFPKKHESTAYECAHALLAYLRRDFSKDIDRWFTPEAVDQADSMVWDEASNRPISQEEKHLDEAIASTSCMEWLDISVVLDGMPTTSPTELKRPDREGWLDDASRSTFGSVIYNRKNSPGKQDTTPTAAQGDPAAIDLTETANDDSTLGSGQMDISQHSTESTATGTQDNADDSSEDLYGPDNSA